MVPWVMTAKKEKVPKKQRKKGDEPATETEAEPEKKTEENKPEGDKTYLRYYHLYRKGELEQDIAEAGGVVVESGYEKDNWWAIASLSD
jgi:tRNA (uracil-5-)-methyltransferase TRM9